MIRLLSATLSLTLLAACGADAPPVRPDAGKATTDGVTISGDARFGIVKQ